MKKYVNGKIIDMTPEEIAAMQSEVKKVELMEKSRPLTSDEVSRMLITAQINTLTVDDNTALRMLEFYPGWRSGAVYTKEAGCPVGYKVRHGDALWKLKQEHTSQTGWEPGATGTESLWEQINETHSGTLDDPIPYSGNMALQNGLYYMQDWKIYLCIRDTVNPVYNTLAELEGQYVEKT